VSLTLDLGRGHKASRDRFCAVLVLVLVSQNALAYEYITARLSALVSWLKIIILCFFAVRLRPHNNLCSFAVKIYSLRQYAILGGFNSFFVLLQLVADLEGSVVLAALILALSCKNGRGYVTTRLQAIV